MKDNKNAYRLDISELPENCISIKSPIVITKDQYELMQKICDLSDERIEEYIKDAVFAMVQSDLEDPIRLGKVICDTLLKQWNTVKPK